MKDYKLRLAKRRPGFNFNWNLEKLNLNQWLEKLPVSKLYKYSKWIKLGLGMFVGLVLILLVSLGYQVFSGGKWNQINNFNFLVFDQVSREVGLLSYQPDKNRLVVVRLGSETMVPVVYGYGQYRIGVVAKLGRQEGYGLKLLEKSVASWMRVPILGVIEIHDKNIKWDESAYWRSQLIWSRGGSLDTADRWKLILKTGGLGDTKMVNVGFEKIEVEMITNVGGNQEGHVDWERGNLEVSSLLKDVHVASAVGVGVAVVNSTPHSGLAREAANRLKSMGYDVVSVTDSELLETDSKVMVRSEILAKDEFWYPLSNLITSKIVSDDRVEDEYRASVVVILGEDYYQLIGKKE